MILLSLRFYVTSLLADMRGSKIAILTVLKALKLSFLENFIVENGKNAQKSKFCVAKTVKMVVIETQKSKF